MDENFAALDQTKRTLIDLAINFGPKLVVAIAILTVGYFAARWVSRPADNLFARLHMELAVRQFLTRVVYGLVMMLFIIMALQNLGVELLPLIAGLGIAGAGIALAMQGVLGNLMAGLTIIFTRPFNIGEYISIVGEEGVVEEIGLQPWNQHPVPPAGGAIAGRKVTAVGQRRRYSRSKMPWPSRCPRASNRVKPRFEASMNRPSSAAFVSRGSPANTSIIHCA